MTTFLELLEEIENQQKALQKLHEKVSKLATDYKHIEGVKPKEKTYTWEESFKGKGFYISNQYHSQNECSVIELTLAQNRKDIATTKKVCLSHLAACQLSHIIEAINKDYDLVKECIVIFEDDDFDWVCNQVWSIPMLKSGDAAKCLIKHHTPLLKQFFGVE